MKRKLAGWLAVLAALVASPAQGDVFVLSSGGQIVGELANPDEVPREKYAIRTPYGLVTLGRQQVVEVRRESAAQREYQKIRPQFADTVEGQWELAEWCRTSGLLSDRETHLKRIIELDPDHEAARRALGYSRVGQRWVTQEQLMTERGYVRYKGRWRLPQEVELFEARRKAELAEKQWFADIKRWRDWLATDRWEKALESIRGIRDPSAVKAVKQQLENERDPKVRELWLEVLGHIGSPDALQVLVNISLEDPHEEVRLSAVDELVLRKHPDIVEAYVKALRSKDNATVNRAAIGLALLEDRTAIEPLIDALVTTHKFQIGQQSQAIRSTFSTSGAGPGGLSVGSRPTIVTQQVANMAVRDALVRLSGVNFNFDIEKWRLWLAAQKKSESVNIRRD